MLLAIGGIEPEISSAIIESRARVEGSTTNSGDEMGEPGADGKLSTRLGESEANPMEGEVGEVEGRPDLLALNEGMSSGWSQGSKGRPAPTRPLRTYRVLSTRPYKITSRITYLLSEDNVHS